MQRKPKFDAIKVITQVYLKKPTNTNSLVGAEWMFQQYLFIAA